MKKKKNDKFVKHPNHNLVYLYSCSDWFKSDDWCIILFIAHSTIQFWQSGLESISKFVEWNDIIHNLIPYSVMKSVWLKSFGTDSDFQSLKIILLLTVMVENIAKLTDFMFLNHNIEFLQQLINYNY